MSETVLNKLPFPNVAVLDSANGSSMSRVWYEFFHQFASSSNADFTYVRVDGVTVSTSNPILDFDGDDFLLTEGPTDVFDLTILDTGIDHDATTNYVADEHVAHSDVILTAGQGLVGGGAISSSRSFALDYTQLTSAATTIGATDLLSINNSAQKYITFANAEASINHNNLTNYSADRHIDHTVVTLTAGAGLTGGGDISSNRTLTVGAGTGITVNADDVAMNVTGLTGVTAAVGDEIPIADVSDSNAVKKITVQGIVDLATAGVGDWVLLDSQSASNSATINFTGLSSTYFAYKIFIDNLTPVTDASILYLRIGTGAGPTYQSNATDYYWVLNVLSLSTLGVATSTPTGDYSDSEITLTSTIGNDSTTERLSGEITCYNPSSGTALRGFQWILTYESDGDALEHSTGSGRYITAAVANTAIRLLMSSGNISAGEFRLYGLIGA